jgi:hypothetical protein
LFVHRPPRYRAGGGCISRALYASAVEGLSLWSESSFLSIGSRGSFASIGSVGSAFSIGSVGSVASAFSIGSAASFGSVLSAASQGSVLSHAAEGALLDDQDRGRAGMLLANTLVALTAGLLVWLGRGPSRHGG